MDSAWEKVVERPDPGGHFVQMFDESDDRPLIRNVGRYLAAGLERGDALLVVANAAHGAALRSAIPGGCDAAERAGRARFVDSGEMLARLMTGGRPDWAHFEREVGRAVRQVRGAGSSGGLRAYGDMVNRLWKARQYAAAIRLEQFWNKLLSRSSFSLFCAYSVDVLGPGGEGSSASLEGVLCTHTHLIPSESNGRLETAIHAAMDEILGPEAETVRRRIAAEAHRHWAVLPSGEGLALRMRNYLPRQWREILSRARQLEGGLTPR